jgi:TaqI-like C-terminal specificity domain
VLRPYVRGQDIDRWRADWAGLWMLTLKSSGDHSGPWSAAGDKAEEVFASTYRAVHGHLNRLRDALIRRQDQGRYWWELRSCAYWDRFDKPKLFYQDITWQTQVYFDAGGTMANNTVYFVPCEDLWVMGVLNSPAAWWFAWRKAQHGKDEALRFFTDFVEAFPIPRPTVAQREQAENCVRRLLTTVEQKHQAVHGFLDWLRSEYEVVKPTQRLQAPAALSEEEFVAEVRKVRGRGRPIGPAALAGLKAGFAESILPLQKAAVETVQVELRLSDCVNAAYGMTPEEVGLLWKTAPPRMPVSP